MNKRLRRILLDIKRVHVQPSDDTPFHQRFQCLCRVVFGFPQKFVRRASVHPLKRPELRPRSEALISALVAERVSPPATITSAQWMFHALDKPAREQLRYDPTFNPLAAVEGSLIRDPPIAAVARKQSANPPRTTRRVAHRDARQKRRARRSHTPVVGRIANPCWLNVGFRLSHPFPPNLRTSQNH